MKKKQTNLKQRKKRRRKKKKLLWGRIILTATVFLLILVGVGVGAWTIYKLINKDDVAKNNVAPINIKQVQTYKAPNQKLTQESLDKPMYILIVGVEQLKQNEIQGLYLVSVNKDGKQLDVIGIPLDSKIVGRDGKKIDQIKGMYKEGGLQLTKAVVEDIFHVQIPYYIVYNEQSFQYIASTLGMPDMYIEKDMNQYDENGTDISLVKGYQTMDSTKTWAYMTYSENNDSGVAKVQRQERMIKEEVEKELDSWRITRGYHVWRYWNKLDTNISTFDAVKFAITSNDIPKENYHYFILPGANEEVNKKIYWDINPIDVQKLVGITINYDGGLHDK